MNERKIYFSVISMLLFMVLAVSLSRCSPDLEAKRVESLRVMNAQLDSLRSQKENVDNAIKSLESCVGQNSFTGRYVDCGKYVPEVVPKAKAEEAPQQTESVSSGSVSLLAPDMLFGPTKVSDKCYISQSEDEHVKKENGGMFATDLACNFGEGVGKRAEVYVPDLRNRATEFRVEFVGQDSLLGSFVQIRAYSGSALSDESFYLAHTETKKKVGDTVRTGERLGQMILNGATTGWHVHFEYRRLSPNGVWMSQRYFTAEREKALDNKRKDVLYSGWKNGDSFYFTHYDLGDVNQNDAAPCIGASGKNMCDMEKSGVRTIALTLDVRKSLGISFGDSVRLEGPCAGTYRVEDEMNYRYRYTNVMRDGFPIKGDIPSCGGGIHKIYKI